VGRTKGAKNKKTLLKEKTLKNKDKLDGKRKSVETSKEESPIIIPVFEEPKERLAVRLFTLEKTVHDDFIKHISQFGDPKLYESYIVNEIMKKYLDKKIKLPKPDLERLYDYMMAYGHVGFEPGTKGNEVDEFKAANRLIHRQTNSFVQYQYPIIVDIDIKSSINNPSYTINECLKLYIIGDIKIDMRPFRIKEWEPRFKYILKKSVQKDEK
jgi:hypothetical protein